MTTYFKTNTAISTTLDNMKMHAQSGTNTAAL